MVSLIHSAQSYLSLFCSKGDSRILGDFVEKWSRFLFSKKLYKSAKSNYNSQICKLKSPTDFFTTWRRDRPLGRVR